MFRRKEKRNPISTNNKNQRDKSKNTGERKLKIYQDRILKTTNKIGYSKTTKKIYQQVVGECTKTYQQPGVRETKQFWSKIREQRSHNRRHWKKLKESEKRDRYLDIARKIQTMEHEGDSDSNSNCCTWNNLQRIGKRTGRLGNKRTIGEHPDKAFSRSLQNTEKSPGDLKDLQLLKLRWKTIS